MFEIIEEYKFKNTDNHISKENYENLFNCDLLIIDDLGTANKFNRIKFIKNSRGYSNSIILT